MLDQQPSIIIVVDEGGLDQHRGHLRIAQHIKSDTLDAAIPPTIARVDRADNLLVDRVGEQPTFSRIRRVISLGAASAARRRIAMDRHEDVGVPSWRRRKFD